MIYRDMTFCYGNCGNEKCERNKIHINWEKVKELHCFVSMSHFEESCEEYKTDCQITLSIKYRKQKGRLE